MRKISALLAPTILAGMILFSGLTAGEGVNASAPPTVQIKSELARRRIKCIFVARDPSQLEEYQQQNRQLAHDMMLTKWGEDQWPSLELLWGVTVNGCILESGWSHWSYGGIPQARPANKMASAGPDWIANPATQIDWGLSYIQQRYGTPSAALHYRLRHHGY